MKRSRLKFELLKTNHLKANKTQLAKSWEQIRLCHKCGEVSISSGNRVKLCTNSNCRARFAPYYFTDTTPIDVLGKPHPKELRQYRAIIGVDVWWSESVSDIDRSIGEA